MFIRILCQIDNWNIISNSSLSTLTDIHDAERSDSIEMNDTMIEDQIILIRLADVDLSSGKKYEFIVSRNLLIFTYRYIVYRNMVRGHVIWKSPIKTYGNEEHQFFYFDIMDESGRIRVKAFDTQCDRVFTHVSTGQV